MYLYICVFSELFAEYKQCTSSRAIVEVQNKWLAQIEAERNQEHKAMYPPSDSEDEEMEKANEQQKQHLYDHDEDDDPQGKQHENQEEGDSLASATESTRVQ